MQPDINLFDQNRELFPRREKYESTRLVCGHLNRLKFSQNICEYLRNRKNNISQSKSLARASRCHCTHMNLSRTAKAEIQAMYDAIEERKQLSHQLQKTEQQEPIAAYMNILPSEYKQFKDKKYWDKFFSSLKNTQNQYFEWYGCYNDYKHLLSILIKQNSHIFHVGCGKSIFMQDLIKDMPKLSIVNCDYSEQVIQQMKQRTSQNNSKNSNKLEYVVCDLYQPLNEEYIGKFDIVVDKGTLDAMLPEDTQVNVNKIKECYFKNVDKSLSNAKQNQAKFIIISLLQPFVLRNLLEYYGFQPNKFQVDIYECLIKDSKLQPFLISITYLNKQKQQKAVFFHRLGKQQPQKWLNLQQTLTQINKIQQQIAHGGKIQNLMPNRHTKYNIYNQNNRKNLRYIIQVIDSGNKQQLNKNTCSIFIVPQGKQNSYIFNDQQGIKSLHQQIKCSRLLLVKLITGNQFSSLAQVKKQINTLVSDFVQKGCDIAKIPYLTDADQLGHKYSLYQNQDVIIDQVLITGQPVRRIFLRSNPTMPQCEFKLTYLSQQNNKELKQINSKILPVKKNLITGIDRQQLYDDSARYIYSGLTALYGKNRLNTSKILMFGWQFAFVKWVLTVHQEIQFVVVVGKGRGKDIRNVIEKYIEMSEDRSQGERLRIYQGNAEEFLQQQKQNKYDIIIDCRNQSSHGQNPAPLQPFYYQQLVLQLLKYPGVYVCQYRNYQHLPVPTGYHFPFYGSKSNSSTENTIFGLNHNRPKTADNKYIIHDSLINFKPRSKAEYQWESDNWKDIGIVYPDAQTIQREYVISKQGDFVDVYGKQKEDNNGKGQGKNKKKKKKK